MGNTHRSALLAHDVQVALGRVHNLETKLRTCVIAINPDKGEHIQHDLANTFIDWLISLPTQGLIGEFGVDKFGMPLFTPDSVLWRER